MKYSYHILRLIITINIHLHTIEGQYGDDEHPSHYSHRNDNRKLYRERLSSDYLYGRSLNHRQYRDGGVEDEDDYDEDEPGYGQEPEYRQTRADYENKSARRPIRNYNSLTNSNPNKKPNHMMKISDLSQIRKDNTQRTSGKADPNVEEKADPESRSMRARSPQMKARSPQMKARSNNDSGVGLGTKLSQPECGATSKLGERIVNGEFAPEGAHPWIVVIIKDGDAWCGGSILNERWVISAAHCFMGPHDKPPSYAIRVGTINRNEGKAYKVEKVISHERFNLDNMLNSDIALLKISQRIKMSNLVTPICLPADAYEEPKTKSLLVAGWGQISYDNPDLPIMLQDINLNIVSDDDCSRRFKPKRYTIYKSQVCSWNEKQDACQGDSGGPAIEVVDGRAYLIGLVSFGSTCADSFPGVYTQVSYFLSWIGKTMANNK